jgi:cell division protease FtsH
MKNLLKNFGAVIIILLIFAIGLTFLNNPLTKPEQVTLSRVVELINEEKVEKIDIQENTLTVKIKDEDTLLEARKQGETSFSEQAINLGVSQERLGQLNIEAKEPSGALYWITNILPFALPILLIVAFFWFMMRQIQGGNKKALSFGQSNVRQFDPNKSDKITFKDVAGSKEAKEELYEVVEFLKDPRKFTKLGAKIPKGVLLLGPPGTGKTLLAKAVAGEANVPFFNISGSEFVEMFVGVGASRVRDLFKKAKRHAPCIIFIDEIDAVGRQRGAGLGGSHDEREQTLNQILIEMDGFETGTNVIVVAATNRPDVLDPALLRPGRFDRRVIIDRPDIKEREAILKVHARNKPLAKDVDLQKLAQRTPGFAGADIMNLLNEAAILAARKNKTTVSMQDCFEAIDKVTLGPERKSRIFTEKEKKITAFHEAGHALVGHILPNADPVHKVSIISRGMAGGFTLNLPEQDRKYHSRAEFIDQLAIMMGGYAAEKLIFGDITTGPSNDLQKASELARNLVMQYGMSELGPIVYGNKDEMVFLGKEIHEQRNYSESVAKDIDDQIKHFVTTALSQAKEIIEKHKDQLNMIAEALIKHETLEKDQFNALMEGKTLEETKEDAKSGA